VAQVIRVASWFYPNWDSQLAGQLLAVLAAAAALLGLGGFTTLRRAAI
jgi:hypothetical protein